MNQGGSRPGAGRKPSTSAGTLDVIRQVRFSKLQFGRIERYVDGVNATSGKPPVTVGQWMREVILRESKA